MFTLCYIILTNYNFIFYPLGWLEGYDFRVFIRVWSENVIESFRQVEIFTLLLVHMEFCDDMFDCVLQVSQMVMGGGGGSSFDIRNPWAILACLILERFIVVSSFRFRLEFSNLKIMLSIWFILVVWFTIVFAIFFILVNCGVFESIY